tara:strand:- start:1317 stop:1811 length:495 start_codon:yes stop_codon:yes gene_type:complete
LKKLTKFLILFLFLTLACNQSKENDSGDIFLKKNINYNKLNFDKIYKIKYNQFLEEWINYNELETYIDEINSNNFSSLTDNRKYLIRFFSGIKNTIPEIIDKREIKSRLTVIETDFLKFESLISKYKIEKDEKVSFVKKINNSFSNLNFQIDKIIEKQQIINFQ